MSPRSLSLLLLLLLPAAHAQNPPKSAHSAANEVVSPERSARVAAALDSLPTPRRVDQAAISPDGTEVACIINGELSVITLEDGASHPIADGQRMTREVTWSPDSRHLAWLLDQPGDVPAAQLWTDSSGGAAPVKLADLKGYAQTPRYSPDGAKLSVLFIEGMPRIAGPLQPMTPLAGVVGEKIFEQRIAVVDLATAHLTQATPPDVYIYEYDWTPDSKSWAATAAHGSGDNNWWIARLYSIAAATGQMRELYQPKLQIADPHVSPDGKFVAFIQGLMSDQGGTGGDVYIVPLTGGDARNLTPGIKASPASLAWTAPDRIAIFAIVDGNSGYASITTAGLPEASPWHGWTGEELIGPTGDGWTIGASFSRDGSVTAVVRQSASEPPEIWAGPIGKWQQLTHVNDDIQPTWGESRNLHWLTNGPGGDMHVEGWLMLPANYNKSKKYPLLVSVHGGPSSACMSKWPAGPMNGAAAASLLGWFVRCPNPRGSYGQGASFTEGNVKDFGGGDYRDIMAGVDAVIKDYPIDTRRIGLKGHSYGGFMTMWMETQTSRFTAAVAGAGICDWLSYYGLNDIDEWMLPFFGASIYDDPAVYQKSDPLHFFKNVKTPTLILVGDRDGEVPMEQSVEWYHALQTLKVPTQLVVYPNEGHIFFRSADASDYTLRMLQWLDHWFQKAAP